MNKFLSQNQLKKSSQVIVLETDDLSLSLKQKQVMTILALLTRWLWSECLIFCLEATHLTASSEFD